MAKLVKIIITLLLLTPGHSFAAKKNTNNNQDIMVNKADEKYFGDDDVRPSLYKLYAKEIKQVENYLNGFETFIAQFKQSNKAGSIRYGKLFISKPGKIRCEYLKPSPVLLIINDNRVTYYDQDLDEVSYTSSDINVLKLLALSEINFSNLNLVEMDKEKQFLTLSIKEDSKKAQPRLFLTLKFSYPQIELKQITITTEENEIDMIFDQITYDQLLGKQLFYFHRDLFRKRR
jgi:outer membrane lipoprotein-sorting protein